MKLPTPPEQATVVNADGYDEVATRVQPSAAAGVWDMPSNSEVTVQDVWVECEYLGKVGFIKAKNLPHVSGAAPGTMLEVLDSFKANKETCMRRHAQQDASAGNVLCYVPNGPAKVKHIECWVECKWRGHVGFVKARHVKPGPPTSKASRPSTGPATVAMRGSGAASSSAAASAPAPPKEEAVKADLPTAGVDAALAEAEEPPAKKPKLEATSPAPIVEQPAEAPPVPPPVVPPAPAPPAAPAATAAPVSPATSSTALPSGAPPQAARKCDCCFEDHTEGAECPGKAHFFCTECTASFLSAFCTADYAEQKKGKGRALCPVKDSELPYGDAALAALVPQDIFDKYLHVRISVAEQGIQEQMEKDTQAKIEELKAKLAKATGDSEQFIVDKHRLEIIDNILTLKCPRCKLAFLDYSGCSAVVCAGCACGFCSYCLEDCGKDAHEHFYKTGKSICPKEGGPIFVDALVWNGYQKARKERMLMCYLAKIPEIALRKKIAAGVAPDAKDLGVVVPEDVSDDSLAKGAGFKLALHVPRKLRGKLAAEKAPVEKKSVVLRLPDPKAPVAVLAPGKMSIKALKVPNGDEHAKNTARNMPQGFQVKVDDEWVECECEGEFIGSGWIKAKHCIGRTVPGEAVMVLDVSGHGGALIRKEAKQAEGKNTIKYLPDNTEIVVLSSWTEVTWPGKNARGFVRSHNIPEDDVILEGKEADCWESAKQVEALLGLEVWAHDATVDAPVKGAPAKGAGRGRGRGRGRGGRG